VGGFSFFFFLSRLPWVQLFSVGGIANLSRIGSPPTAWLLSCDHAIPKVSLTPLPLHPSRPTVQWYGILWCEFTIQDPRRLASSSLSSFSLFSFVPNPLFPNPLSLSSFFCFLGLFPFKAIEISSCDLGSQYFPSSSEPPSLTQHISNFAMAEQPQWKNFETLQLHAG